LAEHQPNQENIWKKWVELSAPDPGEAGTSANMAGATATTALSTDAHGKRTKNGKKKRDANEPKQPLSSYMLYCAERRLSMEKGSFADGKEISKELGRGWQQLPPEEKYRFKDSAEMLRKEYKIAMQKYREEKLLEGGNVVSVIGRVAEEAVIVEEAELDETVGRDDEDKVEISEGEGRNEREEDSSQFSDDSFL
jgi:hypothetical protein